MRIGGDERLLGQISLGLGGHIDEGETIIEAMYRELEEEVGLLKSNILNIAFCGYIYSEASEVDSVHVGMVYRLFTDIETVECLEEDKLFGRFITIDELRELARMGKMESWSELVYKNILT